MPGRWIVLSWLALALLAGCGQEQPAERTAVTATEQTAEQTATRLLRDLEQLDPAPQLEGPSRVEWLRDGPGSAYRLGQERLFIHSYPSADAAQRVAAQIPPSADTGLTDWADEPHFFRCENVIVLYLGKASAVRERLTELCGAQFAGR